MKKCWKKVFISGIGIAGIYTIMQAIAKKKSDDKFLNDDNPYLKTDFPVRENLRIYENIIKSVLDRTLSFVGLIVLFPFFLIIGAAVWIDDPGPIFFTQKRIGKDKIFFMCHKFRTMKMSTPHDVPTHQLENPEQYITKIGRILRKTSLDELPQIWDIFRGKMSIIGPRPALWNQDDLVEERDKYGANNIFPGLTGWAQINGRDELEIVDKAKLDGEYVDRLKSGGIKALFFDMKCFLETIQAVIGSEGIVEGGTGELHIQEKGNLDFIDTLTKPDKKKRILITGKGSYIGESVKKFLENFPDYYEVDCINTIGLNSQTELFVGYDVVFNVAGIAHIKETNENRALYYAINRDLAIDIAKSAKEAGVGQFILLSSMSVYGKTIGEIRKNTIPFPVSAYGESKLAADEKIEQMSNDYFKVAILRPPMVYGKRCKGNYQILRSFALKSRIFPDYNNQRSMIYIGNLCVFVKRIIDKEDAGLFFPQDSEYINTTDMVKNIARISHKIIFTTKLFNPLIKNISINIFKKVFGSLIYEKTDVVSNYNFKDAIRLSEE